MSLDLTIRQKGIIKKTLPISVILGDRLHFGSYDYAWRLEYEKLSENEFIAFLPDALARGFSVTWNSEEKQSIEMRMLTPTSREEIREFYAAVSRIMDYWNADLFVEGEKISLKKWTAGIDDYIDFNTRALNSYCEAVIKDSENAMTFFSAFWPLTIGQEEASRFMDNPEAFEAWMHERLSIDAFYSAPMFYEEDGHIYGRYLFLEDCRTILPTNPSVPFGVNDPDTGKKLICNDFRVGVYPREGDILADVDFGQFIDRLPADQVSRYDEKSVLIEPIGLSDLKKLF